MDEDFVNYKKPSMFICTISCAGKCCVEAGIPISVCQNDGWRECAPVVLPDEYICRRYLNNHITQAIVFGGLEPFEQFDEMLEFLRTLRVGYGCGDDVVIYTGYYREEITEQLAQLAPLGNIVVKFGRFIPESNHRYDEVLGVELSSENQYAERIS